MMARRAAHTLIGSYEAFNTRTGACIAAHWGGSSPATRACCMQPARDLPYLDAALWAELDIALRPTRERLPLPLPPSHQWQVAAQRHLGERGQRSLPKLVLPQPASRRGRTRKNVVAVVKTSSSTITAKPRIRWRSCTRNA